MCEVYSQTFHLNLTSYENVQFRIFYEEKVPLVIVGDGM